MMKFLSIASLMVFPAVAGAELNYDLEMIREASKEVIAMPQQEAEYFTNYMASCGAANIMDDGLPRFYCGQARLAYVMRYKRDRKLDRLMEEREKAIVFLLANKKTPADGWNKVRDTMDKVWGLDEALVEAVAARSAKESSRVVGQSKR